MTAYDVDALIEAFVQEEARTTLVEGLRDAYEHTNPFDPSREADLIVENWLPPILYAAVAERDEQIAALQAQLDAVRTLAQDRHEDAFLSDWALNEIIASAPSDVLDRVKREAAAQALDDAAQKWSWGQWADAPRRSDRVEERLANAQHVGDWLRARAAAIRAEAQQ